MWFGWGIVATLLHPHVNVLEVRAQRLAFCISMVAGFQSRYSHISMLCRVWPLRGQDCGGGGPAYGVTVFLRNCVKAACEQVTASSSGG